MDVISTETGITLGVVVTLIGGVAWLTKLHSIAWANKSVLKAMEKRINQLEIENNQVAERLAKIETKIDYLIKAFDKA